MTLLPEALSDPIVVAIIGLLVAIVWHYQAGLLYHEYKQFVKVKPRLFAILNEIEPFGFRSFIHEKEHPENDPEYYTTVEISNKELWKIVTEAGGKPHLLSSNKRRPDGQLSQFHFVWAHDDGTQTELYSFPDGAIYVHHETVATDVEGHLSDGITKGDPRDVLSDIEL